MGLVYSAATMAVNLSVHIYNHTLLVFTGTGLGLVYSAAIVAVNLSFERYRPVATGSVLAAGGLGIMLMPLLCRFLLDAYGWRHTLGALCALSAQLVVAGALLFPPSAGVRRQPSRRLGNRSEASVQTYIYICVCVCVCVSLSLSLYIYIWTFNALFRPGRQETISID